MEARTAGARCGGCKPDFVLSSSLPIPQVAIFTDGYAFHASPAINRIADDATKRAGPASSSASKSWASPIRTSSAISIIKKVPQPGWYTPQFAQTFMPRYNYNAAAL